LVGGVCSALGGVGHRFFYQAYKINANANSVRVAVINWNGLDDKFRV
jgi:hypothetical protein